MAHGESGRASEMGLVDVGATGSRIFASNVCEHEDDSNF
jgi:hypothetical protein